MQKLVFQAFSVLVILALALSSLPVSAVKAEGLPPCQQDGDMCYITGHLGKPNGDDWAGLKLPYTYKDSLGETHDEVADETSDKGIFYFEVPRGSHVNLIPDRNFLDGYDLSNTFGEQDVWQNFPGVDAGGSGRRSADGYISGPGPCKANVKITFHQAGAATRETTSDGEGSFNVNNLDPVNYIVTPYKAGCGTTYTLGGDVDKSVYIPADQEVNVTGEDQHSMRFDIPRYKVFGRVHLAQPNDTESVSPGLIATYAISGDTSGALYQASINWVDGWFSIDNVPANLGGILYVTRTGGAAAFGYVPTPSSGVGSVPDPLGLGGVRIAVPSVMRDAYSEVVLNGARTITGSIAGQNGVPVIKDSRVMFGSGLSWLQSWAPGQTGNGSAFTIPNAQPKLYYIAPVENGIRSVTPARALVNLTAAASAAAGTFSLTLQDSWLSGCIWTDNGEYPILSNFTGATAPIRLKAAAGTVPYYYAVYNAQNSDCGPGPGYYIWPLPYGISGTLEINNHTSRTSTTVEPQIFDRNNNYFLNLYGDRTISGKLLAAASPYINFDDGDSRQIISIYNRNAAGGYDKFDSTREYDSQIKEFKFFTLERNVHVIEYNQGNPLRGFYLRRYPGSTGWLKPDPASPLPPILPSDPDYYKRLVDVTSGDVDLGTLYQAYHIDIDSSSMATDPGIKPDRQHITFSWTIPEFNSSNQIQGFQFQLAKNSDPWPADSDNEWVQLTAKEGETQKYLRGTYWINSDLKWRVRPQYRNDYGSWVQAPDLLKLDGVSLVYPDPAYNLDFVSGTTYSIKVDHFNGAHHYRYQFADNYGFTGDLVSGTILDTGPGVITKDGINLSSTFDPGQILYYRVWAENSSDEAVSYWSWIMEIGYQFSAPNSAVAAVSSMTSANPVAFTISDSNASLPDDAHYQVNFVLSAASYPTESGLTAANTWLSATPPPNGVLWNQAKGTIPAGTYKWRVRLVVGSTFADAWPIADWYNSATTFKK
jgi:hypothetical protein